jgi:predicted phage terminase large subunit-like protein
MESGTDHILDTFDAATEIAIDREIASRGMVPFIELAWHEVEPARPFVHGWHIDALCDHLEAVMNKELSRLVINVPPGTMKSLGTSVLFPSYVWTKHPQTRFIFGCYADKIARRDSLKTRRLFSGKWYQDRWGHTAAPDYQKEFSGTIFSTTQNGFRMSTTVGGQVTGEHADIQVVDDPIKPLDVTGSMSVTSNALETAVTWWDETMSTRLIDFEKSARIIIMQRLHQGDLAGHVLKAAGYEHLMLPMEYEPKRKCFTSIGFEDPREEAGELLFPERFPRDAVDQLKRELGPRGSAAQLQQDPTPASGTIFHRNQIQFYKTIPTNLQNTIQSWDCTFKETGSSYVVGQVWANKGSDFYLLDQVRDRMSFSTTCESIKHLTAKWKKSYKKLIEAKANGMAVADALKSVISGIVLVEPKGGKEARAHAVESLFAGGNVWLPHPEIAPWIETFIEELIAFPAAVNDDQVDAMTQALTHLRGKNIMRLREAMAKL